MAGAAARDVFYAAHVVLPDQGRAEGILIGVVLAIKLHYVGAARRLVAHVENLIARAEILLRSAMAPQAPLHLQAFLLVHQRHGIDRAVTGVAADSFSHMNAVVEIHEVGELVDAHPLQRLTATVAGADRLQQLGIRPDLRVAVHAGLGWRNAGKARGLDRSVAVTAVDAESGDVVLMAEW